MIMFIKTDAPWEHKVDPHSSGEDQRKQVDHIIEEKKKWTSSGKWANWEKGRKKELRKRRDYFKAHPEKKDDFSGV